MKILFFIDSMRAGGKERRLVELLTYLSAQPGMSLRLAVTEEEIHYSSIHHLGIKVDVIRRSRLGAGIDVLLKFAAIVREFRPDVVHSWGAMVTALAIPSRWAFGRPLVSNLIADTWGFRKRPMFVRLLLRLSIRFSDIVLSNSHAGLRAYELKPGAKVRVIHNGVKLSRFDIRPEPVAVRSELRVTTRFFVIMVATANIWKGYDLLIDVAKKFASLRNDATFVGVGAGFELPRLAKRLTDERVANVVLCGMRADVERLVAASDVSVLFSDSEGISNAILEYMALGKPVIATDLTGGSGEVIEHGVSGYLVPPEVDEVVDCLSAVLDDPALVAAMGAAGRKIIHERFSIERMGQEFERLYMELSRG